jgi:hypothetical protein
MMAGQEHEDIEFLWSQPQILIVHGHGSIVKINLEVTDVDPPYRESTLLAAVSRSGTLSQVLVIRCRKLQLLVI